MRPAVRTYRVTTWQGHVWQIKARSENHAWRLACAKCAAGDHVVALVYTHAPEGACNA